MDKLFQTKGDETSVFLVKLAFKNLTRHKIRTIITALIIVMAVENFIFGDSLLQGISQWSYNNVIDLETGHLQVTDSEYWELRDKLSLNNLFSVSQELETELKKVPHFTAMTPRLKFKANISNGMDEMPIMAWGVNPITEQDVFITQDYLTEGSMFTLGQNEVVLGKNLAKLMDMQLGDYITLLVKSKNGAFNTIDAKIIGVLDSTNPTINSNVVYVPLDIAQKALNIGNQVSEIAVRLDNPNYTEEALKQLSSLISPTWSNLDVHTWGESAQFANTLKKAGKIGSKFGLGIFLLIAAVGIINITILAVLERLDEIGTMKALGLKEKEIILVFLMESLGIGLLGCVIGSIAGTLVALPLSIIGFDPAWLGSQTETSFTIIGKFYTVLDPSVYPIAFIFCITTTLLASILPARWGARKDPVKAIYHR